MKFLNTNMKTLLFLANYFLGNLLSCAGNVFNNEVTPNLNIPTFETIDEIIPQSFSFRSSDSKVDNNTYTLTLTEPFSCQSVFKTSTSGNEFVKKIANMTRQIQTGRCGGMNVSEIQSYPNIVFETIPTGEYVSGIDGGYPVFKQTGFSIKITSNFSFIENPFFQCAKGAYSPDINEYNDSFERCSNSRLAEVVLYTLNIVLLCAAGITIYKNRNAISNSGSRALNRIQSLPSTIRNATTFFHQQNQNMEVEVELESKHQLVRRPRGAQSPRSPSPTSF